MRQYNNYTPNHSAIEARIAKTTPAAPDRIQVLSIGINPLPSKTCWRKLGEQRSDKRRKTVSIITKVPKNNGCKIHHSNTAIRCGLQRPYPLYAQGSLSEFLGLLITALKRHQYLHQPTYSTGIPFGGAELQTVSHSNRQINLLRRYRPD